MIDLSIVIASFETADLLADCFASIEEALQEGITFEVEVIVVDNGSLDGSLERIAASSLCPTLVASVRNRGFAVAMNRGIAIASGRILLLLNSDALVDRSLLEGALALFDADEAGEIGILGPTLVHADGGPQRSVHRAPSLATELLPDRVLDAFGGPRVPASFAAARGDVIDVPAIRGAVFFVRAKLFEEIGLLDEGYFFFLEETDYCVRAREAGYRVVLAHRLEARHQLGASSKDRAPGPTRIEFHRSLYRFLSRHRGEGTRRVAIGLRLLKNGIMLPIRAVAALFGASARRVLMERWALFLWHLRGLPSEPSLARAFEARPARLDSNGRTRTRIG